MKGVLFACMKLNDKGMDELPRLVVINRVFNVHDFSDNDKFNPIDSPCWWESYIQTWSDVRKYRGMVKFSAGIRSSMISTLLSTAPAVQTND